MVHRSQLVISALHRFRKIEFFFTGWLDNSLLNTSDIQSVMASCGWSVDMILGSSPRERGTKTTILWTFSTVWNVIVNESHYRDPTLGTNELTSQRWNSLFDYLVIFVSRTTSKHHQRFSSSPSQAFDRGGFATSPDDVIWHGPSSTNGASWGLTPTNRKAMVTIGGFCTSLWLRQLGVHPLVLESCVRTPCDLASW